MTFPLFTIIFVSSLGKIFIYNIFTNNIYFISSLLEVFVVKGLIPAEPYLSDKCMIISSTNKFRLFNSFASIYKAESNQEWKTKSPSGFGKISTQMHKCTNTCVLTNMWPGTYANKHMQMKHNPSLGYEVKQSMPISYRLWKMVVFYVWYYQCNFLV